MESGGERGACHLLGAGNQGVPVLKALRGGCTIQPAEGGAMQNATFGKGRWRAGDPGEEATGGDR